MRKLLPLLLLLFLPLLSGCFRGGVPIDPDQLNTAQARLEELDRLDLAAVKARNQELRDEIADLSRSKDRALQQQAAQKKLLLAYTWERMAAEDRGALADAVQVYQQLRRTPYESVALFRVAQIDESRLARERSEGTESGVQLYRKSVIGALEPLTIFAPEAQSLLRDPPVASEVPAGWQVVRVRHTVNEWLDRYYKGTWRYQILDVLVRACGGPKGQAPYVLAILLIAVLSKVITTPFSIAQFRSMRSLQAFQPELKKLQEKYKGDKQQLARAQMELMKEHKINPASSCLPMVLQMVILIQVYFAVRHFLFRFEGVPFLYIKSLADPDIIPGTPWPGPLLLLYAASMYFTQKLISMPAATPEQAQQQKMMSYLLPVMMLVIMKPLPAAFIFYWFLQNVLMTGHQWLVMRPHRAAAAAAAAPVETPPPPPPEAIQRLSQGTKPAKKKRRRRY